MYTHMSTRLYQNLMLLADLLYKLKIQLDVLPALVGSHTMTYRAINAYIHCHRSALLLAAI